MRDKAYLYLAVMLLATAAFAYYVLRPADPTTVTVYQQDGRYVADVDGPHGTRRGLRIGSTPHEAAALASLLMLEHAVENPDGGTLRAPPAVLHLVPSHLRRVCPDSTEAP